MVRNLPPTEDPTQVRREIDVLKKETLDIKTKTTQKSREKQVLFLAVSFIVGFVFAQWFIFN